MERNDRISMIAAGLAATWSLTAYGIYNIKMFNGESHPNISTWAAWSFLTILNFLSYKKVTGGWIKSLLPTVGALMVLVTFCCALFTGSAKGLSIIDTLCLIIGIMAGLAWYIKKSASFAQVILQIALVVGFIPTFKAVYATPTIEPSVPWLLWTFCFAAQFFTVKATWKGKYIEFLYPILMFICHGIVFGLTLR